MNRHTLRFALPIAALAMGLLAAAQQQAPSAPTTPAPAETGEAAKPAPKARTTRSRRSA